MAERDRWFWIVVMFVLIGVCILLSLLSGVQAQSQSQMQNLLWRGEPRFEMKGPGRVIGGDVYVLQDNQTDTCYVLVLFLGQAFTPPPQPCAE